MSHPDPLFDPDNSYEDGDMLPEVDDNYDDYDDFYGESMDYDDYNDGEDDLDDSYDDSMDGDAESAFGSCGWGVDEQYESNYDSDW